MAFELRNFQDSQLDTDYVNYLVDQQAAEAASHHGRLWDYFRNPMIAAGAATAGLLNGNSRPYFQAQEAGLPARITGQARLAAGNSTNLQRKEVVIENDIAWRIQTMIDFLFGREITIRSLAATPATAAAIEQVVSAMFEANGGVGFMQELALYGSVYGFVDIALRTPAEAMAVPPSSASAPALAHTALSDSATGPRPGISKLNEDSPQDPNGDQPEINIDRAVHAARTLQLEAIEAPRVLPVLAEEDYKTVRYWIQKFEKYPSRMSAPPNGWLRLPWLQRSGPSPASVEVVEIIGPTWWQRYEDRMLIAEGSNSLGRLPIVHIQNVALPGSYEGLSDVEPLIPLQDELNTRLSDRAHRVTYQAFKMYLGKGIDDFLERPVGPGQMWATQNPNACIEEFGSDSGSPSEDAHIEQSRQALDKVSGVPPLAAGLIRGNVGNLTSATALKVLLSGLLAKTAKKRLTYTTGLKQVVELALHWLDMTGILRTSQLDRRIEVHCPSPLPSDEPEQLRNALVKAQSELPAQLILAELGYGPNSITHSAK